MLRSIRFHWRELTRGQKVLVALQGLIALVFLVLYCTIGTQKYLHLGNDTLRRSAEGDTVVYSGVRSGKEAVLTVQDGGTVLWQLDGVTYGPYTITPDPTATPDKSALPWNVTDSADLVGVQVHEGEQQLLRGAYHDSLIFAVYDMAGNRVDTGLPGEGGLSPGTVLQVALNPVVESRGNPAFFLLGLLFCILVAADILYADDLFRWRLKFVIEDVNRAEPSEWQLMSRWISWIVLTCMIPFLFLPGLISP